MPWDYRQIVSSHEKSKRLEHTKVATLKRNGAFISFDDIEALSQVFVSLGTTDMDGTPLLRLEGIIWVMYMETPIPPSSRKASSNLR